MSTPATEAALARAIGLRSVHAYLGANGWNREESLGGDTADIYVWAEDEREAVIVPASERYGDYGTRIYQIAEQVGRVEGRRMLAVLMDLALAESDLVRVRLPNADDDNAVSLADGAAALDEAKRLLLAAACSADRPDDPEAPERATVTFRPPDTSVLDEAARLLSHRQERTDEEIQGYVSRLARDQAEPQETATIRAFLDGRMTSVKAVFDSSDYSEITRAHRDRLSVSLEGDLRRDGHRWRLRNPRQVAILWEEEG